MIHFSLVHFPIALLVTGAFLLLIALVLKHDELMSAATITCSIGALFTVPTVAAGFWIAVSHQKHHPETFETHRLLGISTMLIALLGVAIHLLQKRLSKATVIRNLLFFAAAGLSLATGSLGGNMAHGESHETSNEHHHLVEEHPSGEHHPKLHQGEKQHIRKTTISTLEVDEEGQRVPEPESGPQQRRNLEESSASNSSERVQSHDREEHDHEHDHQH